MTDGALIRPKHIGARVARTEDPRLLTGRGSFVDDRQVSGLLHVAFRRSGEAHAIIRDIDCTAARAASGVVAVLTAADIAGAFIAPRAVSRMKGYYATALEPLAKGRVRYVGEPIVAVIATSRYIAEDAAELIDIALDPLPVLTEPEQAAAPGAPLIHDVAGSNIIVAREFKRGDPDGQLAQAPVRIRRRFRFRRKTPGAIENRCYLAEIDAGRDQLTFYSTTQVPGIIRNALAEALDMPGSRLRVIAPDVGGGFGGKTTLYAEEILVCIAARRLGRPVKWASDRLEDLISTTHGFDEIIDAEIGLDAGGHILALAADVTGDVGAYSVYPWSAAIEPVQVVSFLPGPYRIQHAWSLRCRGQSRPARPRRSWA